MVLFPRRATAAIDAEVSTPALEYMAFWSQIGVQNGDAVQASWGKQVASVSFYLTAVPTVFYRPAASLALIAGVMWLEPPNRVV
jgi:hypothetical protein